MLVVRAAGADDKSECLQSYVDTQAQRAAGKLGAAREQAASCARDVCPAQVRDDCMTWLRGLDASLPSVVFSVVMPDGSETTYARVFVDDVPIAGALDGRAHPIDPGVHRVGAEVPGYAAVRASVLVHEGEHDRVVRLSLAAPPRKGPPPVPIAFGAVGGAGLAVYAVFGLWGFYGQPGYQSLHDCAPRCAESSVETVRTRFIVSDVGLGVGLVSLGVATVVWLTGRLKHEAGDAKLPLPVITF